MNTSWLSTITASPWPLIGMVHLAPLPGSPNAPRLAETVARAVADAHALQEGGVDALMLENLGDTPYYPGAVPPATVAALTCAALAVRAVCPLPFGINVLRNDAQAALAVATATEASFIRVNVLSGTLATDQGLITGAAHLLLRERVALVGTRAPTPIPGVLPCILADVLVKHASPLGPPPTPEDAARVAEETVFRAGADGVLVSGTATGAMPNMARLRAVRNALPPHVPVLLGSGLTASNAASLVPHASGAVVGTSVKLGGIVHERVDPARVRQLVAAVRVAVAASR